MMTRNELVERLKSVKGDEAQTPVRQLCKGAANEIESMMQTIRQLDAAIEQIQQKYDDYFHGDTL